MYNREKKMYSTHLSRAKKRSTLFSRSFPEKKKPQYSLIKKREERQHMTQEKRDMEQKTSDMRE